jgi:DNA-binding transcriptional LysR family regulator
VDEALEQLGHQRRIAVVMPSFMAAMLVAAVSDLMLTMPLRVAERLRQHLPLRLLPPPVELPAYEMHQVWHERDHHDPAHRWLRGLVLSTLQADDEEP